MCGLVGLARFSQSGLYSADVDLFTSLLIADSVRGADGTGLIAINAKGRRQAFKVKGHPYNLFAMKEFDTATSVTTQPYLKVLAGHNRYTTKGESNSINAHPFSHGHITMMHNGTLTKYDDLPARMVGEVEKPFIVDSDHFCYAVSQWGFEKTVSKILGAYAVVFYDAKEKTLNFARNYQRPLFIATNPKDEEIIWGSEKEMLFWAMSRHNSLNGYTYEELPVNELHSFSIQTGEKTVKEMPTTGSAVSYSSSGSTYYGGWESDMGESYAAIDGASTIVPPEQQPLLPPPNPLPPQAKSTFGSGQISYNQKIYTNGDTIKFVPYNLIALNKTQERFKLVGKSPFFEKTDDSIVFNTIIAGKDMAEILVEEAMLTGIIKNIVHVKQKDRESTVVWLEKVDFVDYNQVNKASQALVYDASLTKH